MQNMIIKLHNYKYVLLSRLTIHKNVEELH
jgi:hypothetical protein